MTTEDELILLGWIKGMQDTLYKDKIIERLQISNMNFEASIEFLQLELFKEFNQQKDYQETYNTTKFMIKCKYCGKEHERNKYECPVLKKDMFKLWKKKMIFWWYSIIKE